MVWGAPVLLQTCSRATGAIETNSRPSPDILQAFLQTNLHRLQTLWGRIRGDPDAEARRGETIRETDSKLCKIRGSATQLAQRRRRRYNPQRAEASAVALSAGHLTCSEGMREWGVPRLHRLGCGACRSPLTAEVCEVCAVRQ